MTALMFCVLCHNKDKSLFPLLEGGWLLGGNLHTEQPPILEDTAGSTCPPLPLPGESLAGRLPTTRTPSAAEERKEGFPSTGGSGSPSEDLG